jgi:mevalonate kinase
MSGDVTAAVVPTGSATVTASAPGKVILFGEHAINRGQPALAVAVGLRTRCTRSMANTQCSMLNAQSASATIVFRNGSRSQTAARHEILSLGKQVDAWRVAQDYDAIRQLARADFFAPQKYILASAFSADLPDGLTLEWESEVPPASGFGSGGAAFVAMVAAMAEAAHKVGQASSLSDPTAEAGARTFVARSGWKPDLLPLADLALRGDIVAHGGIASALDTQTSLLGGVIRYTGKGVAEQVECAPGLSLLIAHTGVSAPTSEVNARVRRWLAEQPQARMNYFEAIGELTRAAVPLLQRGDWRELGRLMTLNQRVLEQIGVSCPQIDRLIKVALNAGAYGAKLSGSGGGGIIIALVAPEKNAALADALAKAGGQVFTPQIGVEGARIEAPNSKLQAPQKLP